LGRRGRGHGAPPKDAEGVFGTAEDEGADLLLVADCLPAIKSILCQHPSSSPFGPSAPLNKLDRMMRYYARRLSSSAPATATPRSTPKRVEVGLVWLGTRGMRVAHTYRPFWTLVATVTCTAGFGQGFLALRKPLLADSFAARPALRSPPPSVVFDPKPVLPVEVQAPPS